MNQHQQQLELLHYARFHRLSKDHLDKETNKIPSGFPSIQDIASDLHDPPGVFAVDTGLEFLEVERLNIDKEGKRLLSWILTCRAPQSSNYRDDSKLRLQQNPKLEIPLLKTDHETDMKYYAREKHQALDSSVHAQIELNIAKDEGFDWPPSYARLPQQCDATLYSEKLEVSRDALALLKSALTKEKHLDVNELYAQELSSHRGRNVAPITPPLFPAPFPVSTPRPSSPIGNFSLLSDHTSPIVAEVRRLDEAFAQADGLGLFAMEQGKQEKGTDDIVWSDFLEEDLLNTPKKASILSSSPRRLVADLKMEVPLTPPTSEDALQYLTSNGIPQEISKFQLHEKDKPEEDLNMLVRDVFGPPSKVAESSLQHEQLVETDSASKVNVAKLDISFPELPWDITPSKAQKERDVKDIMLPIANMRMHHWSGISRLERDLPWSPFPLALGKAAEDDRIQDDELVARFTESLTFANAINQDSLTWKSEGVRLLDESEGEDELVSAVLQRPDGLDFLVRKRMLSCVVQSLPSLVDQSLSPDKVRGTGEDHVREKINDTAGRVRTIPASHMAFGGLFSASSALSHFMDLQGPKPKRVKLRNPSPGDTLVIATRHAATPRPQSRSAPSPSKAAPSNPVLPPPYPAPGHAPFQGAHACIFSSKIVSQRNLTRHIAAFAPALEVIERNLEPRPIAAVASKDAEDPLQYEADIAISPSTGIICTALQMIKQKPLPGQTRHSGVRERIAKVSLRYENLVVFVAGSTAIGGEDDSGMLEGRDCQALVDFTIFCKSMDDGISIIHIPLGEESEARWIVGLMSTMPQDPAYKLLQEETSWELLLRRAGMNAFAAQLILMELKPPSELTPVSEALYGLPAFVHMTLAQRYERFGRLLGGTKVLSRASAVLDADWTLLRS